MNKSSLRSVFAGLAIGCASVVAAHAEPLIPDSGIKTSRLFVNDFMGDHKDRWRTSSYAVSRVIPSADGAVNELRFRGENIAGSKIGLKDGAHPDRPAAGIIGLGYYRSDRMGNLDFRIGGEISIVGPQTRVIDFQKSAHDLMGMDPPSDRFIETQIGNGAWLSANLELGRDYLVAPNLSIRPWIGAGTGIETLARVGADLTWGAGAAGFGVRDEVTGWRKPLNSAEGASLLLGVDHARVFHTELLARGEAEDGRTRIRAGGLFKDGWAEVFYGATYLSEEFRAQESGQVVGALSFSFGF